MATSIKITELTSIGANISHTSLAPVVDMAGTPETKKATIQTVGNLILEGAGGVNFAPANVAIVAQTVSNAAQPAITSVGTLTSLAVTGNITSGNLNGGNLVSANFFSGDGSFLDNVAVSSIENGTSSIEVDANASVRASIAGSANVFVINSSNVEVSGDVIATTVKTTPVLVSALPAAATVGAGARAFVTDANDNTFGAAVVGSGANSVPVYSDGTSWLIG